MSSRLRRSRSASALRSTGLRTWASARPPSRRRPRRARSVARHPTSGAPAGRGRIADRRHRIGEARSEDPLRGSRLRPRPERGPGGPLRRAPTARPRRSRSSRHRCEGLSRRRSFEDAGGGIRIHETRPVLDGLSFEKRQIPSSVRSSPSKTGHRMRPSRSWTRWSPEALQTPYGMSSCQRRGANHRPCRIHFGRSWISRTR
jgi:hypothetical protein